MLQKILDHNLQCGDYYLFPTPVAEPPLSSTSSLPTHLGRFRRLLLPSHFIFLQVLSHRSTPVVRPFSYLLTCNLNHGASDDDWAPLFYPCVRTDLTQLLFYPALHLLCRRWPSAKLFKTRLFPVYQPCHLKESLDFLLPFQLIRLESK